MPYTNPDDRRRRDRERYDARRRQPAGNFVPPPGPVDASTAASIRDLLQHTLTRVVNDPHLDSYRCARAVANLASVALKAVELTGIERELSELELRLQVVKGGFQ